MNPEQTIIEYLQKNYNPKGIILHGSRATGKDRAHSDWDLYLIFNEMPELDFHREDIAGEDIEWKAIVVPIAKENIINSVGVQLQFSKVLWEETSEASDLIALAHEVYSAGRPTSEFELTKWKQYLTHKVHGLEDDKETPYMFLRHQYAFFERAVNWWFETKGQYRKPFYIALPLIQEKDPEYYDLLITFCSDQTTKEEKIETAKKMVGKLFN